MQLGDGQPLLRVWGSLDKWLPKSPSTVHKEGLRLQGQRRHQAHCPVRPRELPPLPQPNALALQAEPPDRDPGGGLSPTPRVQPPPTGEGPPTRSPHLPRLGPRRGREAAWPPGLASRSCPTHRPPEWASPAAGWGRGPPPPPPRLAAPHTCPRARLH